MTTLVRKGNANKSGGVRYGLPGVRASAYFPPTMFVGDPPDAITVDEPSEPATGPDGQPLLDDAGNQVMRGLVFATESTQKPRGTTGGVRVNAELQKAREEAKRLREESKRVLKEARAAIKAKRSGKTAEQGSLVEEGAPA